MDEFKAYLGDLIETTTNLIGNGVDLLLRSPAALLDLRADPTLIGTAVEEFLRLESSNQLGNRRAARDTELGGVAMPTGIHACAGMWLARMEGQVAIGRLVRRFATIERDGAAVRGGRARFRGFLRYPVRVRS